MRAPRIFGGQKNCEKNEKKRSRGLSRHSAAKAEARIQEPGGAAAKRRMGEWAKRRIRRCASLIINYSLREMVRQCPALNKPQSSWLLDSGSWLLFFAYFAATGTGITSLPFVSAMKLSLVPDELPLASLVPTVIFNFLVGFSGSFNFVPPGPS